MCSALEAQLQRPLVPADLAEAQQQLEALAGGSTQLPSAQQLLAAMLSGAAEFAPVCAVLGGVMANNVVAAVSANGAPLNNLLYYTLFDGRAIVETQSSSSGAAAAAKAAPGATGQQKQKQEQVVIDDD